MIWFRSRGIKVPIMKNNCSKMLSIWIVERISRIDPAKCREASIFIDITVLQKQLLDEIKLTGFKYIFEFRVLRLFYDA